MIHGDPRADWHPDLQQLLDFGAGRLNDSQLQFKLEEHVRTCNTCLAQMEQGSTDQLQQKLRTLGDESGFQGTGIGRYELIDEIGRGGVGVVYRAKQAGLDRQIAVKMLLRGDRANRAELSRFRRESIALARLSHPNIVQIFDSGELNGVPFIAMEFIEGETLAQRLQRGPMDIRLAAQWMHSLADAIGLAHQMRILHRDLKPQNILLAPDPTRDCPKNGRTCSNIDDPTQPDKGQTPGHPHNWMSNNDEQRTPKLVDFGLAHCQDATQFHTATGETLGTPAYMAPEAIAGKGKSTGEEALDIYGLGAILYECLTGRPPFTGSSTWEILDAVANCEPVSITSLRGGVPRDLVTICNRCMVKRPERRFASAQELADDLKRFLEGHPIRSRRISPFERMWRWAGRRPAFATACLLGVILVTTIPLLLLYQNWSVQEERNLAQTQYAAVRETLHDVLAELDRNTGSIVPEATQLAARQVSLARKMFEQLAMVDGSPQSDFDLGKVLIKSATIEKMLGNDIQAQSLFDLAEKQYRRHQTSSEHQVAALQGLFQVFNTKFVLLHNSKELDKAKAILDAVIEIQDQLERLHREIKSPSKLEMLHNRQWLLNNRGTLAGLNNDLDEAAGFYQQSLEVLASIREQGASGPDQLLLEAGLRVNLASAQMQMQQYEAGEASYRQALADMEAWANENTRTAKWVEDWSGAVLNRSNLLNALGRKEEAFSTLENAQLVLRQAINNDPGRVRLRELLFMVAANRASFCPYPDRLVEAWRDAVADSHRSDHLVYSRQMLGRVLSRQGELRTAFEELHQLDSQEMTVPQLFLQAACHGLLSKYLLEADQQMTQAVDTMLEESVQESWRLLQELAQRGELDEGRIEHLKSSEDWIAIRDRFGQSFWERFDRPQNE